jgi:hypothetical protein
VTALRATLADKDKTVGDMQAELRDMRAKLGANAAVVSEKEAQVASLTSTVAERDRTIAAHGRDARRAAPVAGPVAGSVVAVGNFHAGARVKFDFSGGYQTGVIHSIEGALAIGRWDAGHAMRMGVPNPTFKYM